MRPAVEVVPEIVAAYRRRRGPQKTPTKQLVSLRLDRDVIAHFRKRGPGWQRRINDTLRKAARLRAEGSCARKHHGAFPSSAAATASWSLNGSTCLPMIWPVSWPLPAINSTSPRRKSAMDA